MWIAESLETTRLVRDPRPRPGAQRMTLTAAVEPLARRGLVKPAVDPADLPRAHEARRGRQVEG